jgi:hypothetical protein
LYISVPTGYSYIVSVNFVPAVSQVCHVPVGSSINSRSGFS